MMRTASQRIVKLLAKLEHHLTALEEKFKAQDLRLLAIEGANQEILTKLAHITLALDTLQVAARDSSSPLAQDVAVADPNNNDHTSSNHNVTTQQHHNSRLLEQLHKTKASNQSLFHTLQQQQQQQQQQHLNLNLSQHQLMEQQQQQHLNLSLSGGPPNYRQPDHSHQASASSSLSSSPSMSPTMDQSMQQQQQQQQVRHQLRQANHLLGSPLDSDRLQLHLAAPGQEPHQAPNHQTPRSQHSDLSRLHHNHQHHHHQHHHPLSLIHNGSSNPNPNSNPNQNNNSNNSSNSTSNNNGNHNSGHHSSASMSPSLGVHSALSSPTGSPLSHQPLGPNPSDGPPGAASNLSGLSPAQLAAQVAAAAAANQAQAAADQQSTVAAMAAASQFLSALARSQVGGQLGDLDQLTQSHLLASTLGAAASASLGAGGDPTSLATNLSNLHRGGPQPGAPGNSLPGGHLGAQNGGSQQQTHNNRGQPMAGLSSGSPAATAAAVAAQLSSLGGSGGGGGGAGQGGNNQAPNQSSAVIHSIPHPHSHHALSHPAASLLISNPHYQTVRTKYSTRRYSRRRVGPDEAMADPAIRATVQLKMPVVPKTILIVLKHRLTVQTAITLACAQTGERLRKGAIQKKLEAMFREPGAVDAFLAEWNIGVDA